MRVEKREAKLIVKKQLTGKFWWFELEFEDVYEFKAGQYVSVKVNEAGERRAYSVATAPGGKKIGLLVDVSPGGEGSKFFLKLRIGEEVETLGPLGRFGIEDESLDLLLVATGSGIAPMRAMIDDLLRNKAGGCRYRLVWGLRNEKDVFWQEELGELEERYKNFEYELVLSKPGANWQGKRGRVTDLIREMKDLGTYGGVYLCGSNEMIGDCKRLLLEKGVVEEKIYFEKFG